MDMFVHNVRYISIQMAMKIVRLEKKAQASFVKKKEDKYINPGQY